MVKYKNLLLIIFIYYNNSYCAQEIKNNAVYIEFFGNTGTPISINYERLINTRKLEKVKFIGRIGGSIGKNKFDHKPVYIFPLELNSIIGKNNNKIELGFGYTSVFGTSNLKDSIIPEEYKNNNRYALFLRLGYRLVNEDGLILRIAPLAYFEHDPPLSKSLTLHFTFGISLGFYLNKFWMD